MRILIVSDYDYGYNTSIAIYENGTLTAGPKLTYDDVTALDSIAEYRLYAAPQAELDKAINFRPEIVDMLEFIKQFDDVIICINGTINNMNK